MKPEAKRPVQIKWREEREEKYRTKTTRMRGGESCYRNGDGRDVFLVACCWGLTARSCLGVLECTSIRGGEGRGRHRLARR